MLRYTIIRILQGIIALLLMTVLIFFLARLTGSPLDVLLPEQFSLAEYEEAAKAMGLDKPLYQQYGIFMRDLLHGDFGNSIFTRRPAAELVLNRLPATMLLAGIGMLLATTFGFLIGVVSAVRKNSWFDWIGKGLALLGQSIPAFWLGIMLMLIFSIKLNLLPVAGYGSPQNIVLPAITIGYFQLAGIMRIMRSSMLDTLDSECVKFLRIKGLPERFIIWKHAVKNASLPALTFASVQFIHLLMGAIVVETVFNWPGVGLLAYQSVLRRDFPVLQGIVLVVAFFFIVGNLAVDLFYAYLDPRIRYRKV